MRQLIVILVALVSTACSRVGADPLTRISLMQAEDGVVCYVLIDADGKAAGLSCPAYR